MNKEQSIISCIKKSLEIFPDSAPTADWDSLIAAMRKYNKPIAGYRFYDCEECGHSGKQKTRDCHSPSHEICEMCHSEASIINREEHPEWSVDKSGNLV